MRFESAKNMRMTLLMYALCVGSVAIGVLYCIFFENILKYLIALMCVILLGLVLWVRRSTYYELREDVLFMKSGPFRDEIAYEEIKTLDKTSGWDFIMALANDRLQINAGLNPEKGKIVLSPEREDEFIAELHKHCPELTVRG